MTLPRPIKALPIAPEEEDFLLELEEGCSAQFRNVLTILRTDAELQPLILDHRKLLYALRPTDIKPEQMLAIISAAESEMYESSKELEEKQALITQLQHERSQNSRLASKLTH